MDEIAIGHRVMLHPERADTWIDPKMRLRVQRRCPATIRSVIGTKIPERERSYLIEFDAIGRMKAFVANVPRREILPLPAASTREDP